MKCPKCGYISFDYNQACPKCSKDISAEQRKLNMPSYRPSPPSLLGALTGEADDSGVGLKYEGAEETAAAAQEVSFSLEDSQTIGAMEEAFEEGQDLEMKIEARPDEGEPFPEYPEKTASLPKTGGKEEEISFDFSDISLEELESGEGPAQESAQEEEDLAIDFDDLSLDESTPEAKPAPKDVSLDTAEMITSEIDLKDVKISEDTEDLELDLDLKNPKDESS